MDETNSAFRTFEVDRLEAHELFIATLSLQIASLGLVLLLYLPCYRACASRLRKTQFEHEPFGVQLPDCQNLVVNQPEPFLEPSIMYFYEPNAVEREFHPVDSWFPKLLLVTNQTCVQYVPPEERLLRNKHWR
ncbi:hypothetical protein Tco_1166759 [Tanacetum coccineum]